MNRIRILTLLSLVGVALFVIAHKSHSQSKEEVKTFMRVKLLESQKVLEGLTTEDYELITKGAGQMEMLSQDAAWQVLQTAEYRQQSLEFRRSTQALKEAAERENMDAAALAYVDVALKCVKCHQYITDVRNGDDSDGL